MVSIQPSLSLSGLTVARAADSHARTVSFAGLVAVRLGWPSRRCAKMTADIAPKWRVHPIGSCHAAERRFVRDRKECSGNAGHQADQTIIRDSRCLSGSFL